MHLTNRQLVNSIDSLSKLSTLKLPVKTSFKVAKISRMVDVVLKDYRQTLQGVQDEYAEKDDAGEKVVIENLIQFVDKEAFEKSFSELLDCETDLAIDKISIDDFGSVEIEPHLLYHLDWLVEG